MLKRVIRWIKKPFWLVDDHVDRFIAAALPEPATIYFLPHAPLTGRRVDTPDGKVFIREASGTWLLDEPDSMLRYSWGALLERYGSVQLVPETAEEKAIAAVYGPSHARWGDPSQPCPFKNLASATGSGCALRLGHTGWHTDAYGNPIGIQLADDGPAIKAAVTREDMGTPCTCGMPSAHRPGCPRFYRVQGGDHPNE